MEEEEEKEADAGGGLKMVRLNLHYKFQRLVGWILYKLGYKLSFSTGIHDLVTAGYGELDDNGFWEYPAPSAFWKSWLGCASPERRELLK